MNTAPLYQLRIEAYMPKDAFGNPVGSATPMFHLLRCIQTDSVGSQFYNLRGEKWELVNLPYGSEIMAKSYPETSWVDTSDMITACNIYGLSGFVTALLKDI